MKPFFILFIPLILFTGFAYAQDKVYLKDGSISELNVVEQTQNVLRAGVGIRF